ncbi:serine hydrolase domain-containing protein [Streptomyces sp. NPDC003077]|uniref:serine hydrolase domain-containing protein n=1 Tax=Streptomyces sp. NPDC003077 TaxID=3154443 RepID=UPI0033B05849
MPHDTGTGTTDSTAARVAGLLNRHPMGGLALGVVRDGRLAFFHGHGLADAATRTPVTEDTVFRVASITKTFTAIAVMQLWEQGLVDLDAPAHTYLRAFRLVPDRPGFRPVTPRHLLTHTSGIGELRGPADLFRPNAGEGVPLGAPLPPLADYYRDGLRVTAEPGTQWVYTNHGFAALGQLVEDVSGQPLDRYLREHVFAPLGMSHTDLVRSPFVQDHLATGYALGRGGMKPVTDRERATPGASSAYSTPRDMARYVAALLNGGANDHGSVLKPATLAAMFEPQYQPDPRVPGMGLAFFRAAADGHRLVEHQGILPGFTSQVFLAPDDGVGVVAFTNAAHHALLWLPAETVDLMRHLLGLPPDAPRTDVAHHPEVWDELQGWYHPPGRATDIRARAMAGAAAQVVLRHGRLVFRSLVPAAPVLRGLRLLPDDVDDPYVFRIDLSAFGLGAPRIVFGGTEGERRALHFAAVPMTLHKR